MIGYIGLALLCIAYATRLTKKHWMFVIINIFATAFLLAHAIMIGDIPFMIVNAFVGAIVTFEFFQRKVWKHLIPSTHS